MSPNTNMMIKGAKQLIEALPCFQQLRDGSMPSIVFRTALTSYVAFLSDSNW